MESSLTNSTNFASRAMVKSLYEQCIEQVQPAVELGDRTVWFTESFAAREFGNDTETGPDSAGLKTDLTLHTGW